MIKKAVIMCGGLATRFMPFCKSVPKEMMPVLNYPSIHYIIEDLSNAGIKDVLIVIGRGKESIERYFDRNIELEERFKKATDKVTRPTINTLYKFENAEDWWEFYKKDYFLNIKKSLDIILKQNALKHNHLLIMAGNLTNSKLAWKCLLDLTSFLSKSYDMNIFDSYANVCPHPDIESLKTLKSHGIKQVQYNLEVSNPKIFAEMCPGKISYEEFKLKLFEAVEVFAKGNVRSNMVIGLQDFNELLKDTKYFAQNGIVFDYSVFQPKKHTPLENYPSPQMVDVVNYTKELAKIYKTYNFKPIYCSISSRSSIVNEAFNDAN